MIYPYNEIQLNNVRNELLIQMMTQLNLKIIMLSERNHNKKLTI